MSSPTFAELCKLPYKDQAIFFLNGTFKAEAPEEANLIWEITENFKSLDDKKAAGNDLDEFSSH
eukprot:Awhi_evm1s15559